MLRQALNDAEEQQRQKNEASETTALGGERAGASSSTTTIREQHLEPPTNYGSLVQDAAAGREEDNTVDTEEQDLVTSSSYDFPSTGEEEEGDYLLGDDEDEEEEEEEPPDSPVWQKIWRGTKSVFVLVANVENLWDTPSPDMSSYDQPSDMSAAARRLRRRRRNKNVVLFWFVVLAVSYATERSSFKLLVDRAGPFRLVSVQMITATHSIMLGMGMLFGRYCACFRGGGSRTERQQQQFMPLGIPLVDVGLMSLLDIVGLLCCFLSGSHVPPTLTVILVQFTIPLTGFLTQFIHPDGRCSCSRPPGQECESSASSAATLRRDNRQRAVSERPSTSFGENNRSPRFLQDEEEALLLAPPQPPVEGVPLPGWGGLSAEHVWGSLILSTAVLLSLLPAFYSLADPDFFIYADTIPMRTAYNTLLYVSSCIPAAASQLYKEHIFLQYKQPVNMDFLNLLLSCFQFVLASIMSPLVFILQGLGARNDWTQEYPSSAFGDNFLDGLECFAGTLSKDDQENKWPDDARCKFAWFLCLLYAFSIISVGVAVDKIVNAGATKVMYRGISAGTIVAVLTMHFYDMHLPDFNYGPTIDALNLLCLILLILGAEVYHRVSLQESTFETVYPEVPVQSFYDE